MNANPTVSIITVCLNSERTIRQTIESVLGQTYDNIEYIIVDGGSTDHTLSIINDYKDCIDIIISEKDNGIYDAFNKGIRHSSGEIIGIINSDDWYASNAVELSVKALVDSGCELCCANAIIVEGDIKTRIFKSNINVEQWCGAKIRHPSVFALKDLYKTIGLFDSSYKLAADYKWLLEVFLNHRSVTYIDKETVFFRRGGVSNRPESYFQTLLETYRVVEDLVTKYRLSMDEYKHVLDYWKVQLVKARDETLLKDNPQRIESFLKNVITSDRIIIWGTGHYGRIIRDLCANSGIGIAYFIDSDPLKRINEFCQLPVKRPEEVIKDSYTIFIAIDMPEQMIGDLISQYGICENRIVTLDDLRRNLSLIYGVTEGKLVKRV